ncbi:hypothetical protein [Priestia megaterium]|uniref:Uncharacterized protein n=1 Tax=Priestia megaterium (strain DSM 319 / IMG 1521) TaxID=592022 RepID=D5DDI2_PRIM3|nr:hypothetical protein [Priestia megaterium]ADF38533.1 hypothetical protein BMD_1677 [Priestia megaterium DSM 319]MED4217067.1 hypothetical protein [Priestia megaterium]WEZ37739.1 hypothetical protein P5636_21360 [Priestia megaterium DSM 319]
MKKEEKVEAEEVLCRLFKGGKIKHVGDGIRSDYFRLKIQAADGQPLVITAENKWTVSPVRSFFSLIAKQEEITDIFLGEQEPHLTLQFTSGVLLTIFGVDNLYESWQAGTESQDWLVVACPSGDVAVWSPENEENV